MNGWRRFALLLGLVAVLAWTVPAPADSYLRQTIANNSGQTANDLHLEFTNDINGAKLRPKDQPPGHDGDGTVPGAPDNDQADWAPPDTFGTVAPGGIAYVDYAYSGYKPYVDEDNSYWTQDGNQLPGFVRRGLPMAIRGSRYDEETVTITNDQATPQRYRGSNFGKTIASCT